MSATNCQLIGRWRIDEADQWDRDYLDLIEPAYINIGKDGTGEFVFGVVNAMLDVEFGESVVFFTWTGSAEWDEIRGSGSAELQDDGTIEIELSFEGGDHAIMKARRERPLGTEGRQK